MIDYDVNDMDVENWLAQVESLEDSGVKFSDDYDQFLGNMIDDMADLESPNHYIVLRGDNEEAKAICSYHKKNVKEQGTLKLDSYKRVLEIDFFAVAPIYQRNVQDRVSGLGRKLFDETMKHARELHADGIMLVSLNHNSDVFYEKMDMSKYYDSNPAFRLFYKEL